MSRLEVRLLDADLAAVEVDRLIADDREHATLTFTTEAGAVVLCASDRAGLRRLLVEGMRELAR